MKHHVIEAPAATPGPPLGPLRVLVEDPKVADVSSDPHVGIEVTICSGPPDVTETCPLVLEGSCPLGPFDVVVSALQGPWARCVHAAWTETDTSVVDGRPCAVTDPVERLDHHVGLALQHLWVGSNGAST
jgi:hypothetical protein